MSSETETQQNQTLVQETIIGRVKWFNNKAGYGFITTMSDVPMKNNDIFVHHSSIDVVNEQYKYLVQGEYVQFHIIRSTDSEHEYQAVHIQGILGGKLMCETIKDIKQNKVQYRQTHRGDNEAPQLDTQQLLSLPVFNVSVPNDTRPFTVVRRGKPDKRQVNDLEPPTPRKPRNTNQRRQSFYQG
jgi:cold shock CspA family protein